jgi:sugar phosphate isomerase/epimerase
MESPNIVAHPVLDVAFCDGKNKELARQRSLDYFGALVPALKENGVTMCIENLFFYIRPEKRWASNYCSEGEELAVLIDTLNQMYGPYFAACVDTGHAVVAQKDPAEMLKALGSRVKVLHIQDNHALDLPSDLQ